LAFRIEWHCDFSETRFFFLRDNFADQQCASKRIFAIRGAEAFVSFCILFRLSVFGVGALG
jgi:hypothetical protein